MAFKKCFTFNHEKQERGIIRMKAKQMITFARCVAHDNLKLPYMNKNQILSWEFSKTKS